MESRMHRMEEGNLGADGFESAVLGGGVEGG